MKKTVTITLDNELVDALNEQSEQCGVSFDDLVNEILKDYIGEKFDKVKQKLKAELDIKKGQECVLSALSDYQPHTIREFQRIEDTLWDYSAMWWSNEVLKPLIEKGVIKKGWNIKTPIYYLSD